MINFLPPLLRVLRPRTPVVVTLHGFHERRIRWRVIRALPMLLASQSCIFVHHKDRELVNRTFNIRDRISLIPISSNIPAIRLSERDLALTRSAIGLAEDDRVVIFFGDFREEKGVLQLLAAATEVRSKVPNLKLVLVGGLWNRKSTQFKQYAQNLQEALDRAHAAGFLVTVTNPDSHRVAALLRAADLAVFPFLNGASENRGSILAAIVNETATLTTFGRSTSSEFANEYGVDLVPAGDVDALASRMSELLQDSGLLGFLREQSALAAQRLSWEAIADRHIQLYSCRWSRP